MRLLLKRGRKIAANINSKNRTKIAIPTGSIVYISIVFELIGLVLKDYNHCLLANNVGSRTLKSALLQGLACDKMQEMAKFQHKRVVDSA